MPLGKQALSVSYRTTTPKTADYCTADQSKKSALRMLGPAEIASISESGCRLSIATIVAVTNTAEQELHAQSRSTAEIALARQTAMYLAHTKFGITYSEVGSFFNRDRSTVAHACRLVEDRRDIEEFDECLCRMENLVDVALRGSFVVQQFASSEVGNAK